MKSSKWYEKILGQTSKIRQRIGAGLMAGSILFSSMFGAVGCAKQPDDNNIVAGDESKQDQLQDTVDSLNGIIDELKSENVELNAQLSQAKDKITAIESSQASKDEKIDELNGVIEGLKNDIDSIYENFDGVVLDQFAKVQAKLAFQKTCDNSYIEVVTNWADFVYNPNGDMVAERLDAVDYAYYNKSMDVSYVSEDGEEMFEVGNPIDWSSILIEFLDVEGTTFNKDESTQSLFVFNSAYGEKVTIEINNGRAVGLESVDTSINESTSMSISSQERYEEILVKCKAHLSMIGLYEAFTKQLDDSLSFQYGKVEANTSTIDGVKFNGELAYRGRTYALELKNNTNDKTEYETVLNGTEYHRVVVDSNGNLVNTDSYDAHTMMTVSQVCKNMIYENIKTVDADCKISQDDNGTYTIVIDDGDEAGVTFDITFNDDLSVEIVGTEENGEVYSYKIEQITKEQFNEIYNRITNIVKSYVNLEEDLTV